MRGWVGWVFEYTLGRMLAHARADIFVCSPGQAGTKDEENAHAHPPHNSVLVQQLGGASEAALQVGQPRFGQSARAKRQ